MIEWIEKIVVFPNNKKKFISLQRLQSYQIICLREIVNFDMIVQQRYINLYDVIFSKKKILCLFLSIQVFSRLNMKRKNLILFRKEFTL